jgi:hypothetical protein
LITTLRALRAETRQEHPVRAELDENQRPKGGKVSDAEFTKVNLSPHPFDGECNCTIAPIRKPSMRRKNLS